jgi:hypothetical protein
MRELPELKLNLSAPETFGNLAEKLHVDERRVLAEDLIELINVDEKSMGDWLGEAKGYLDEVEAETSKQPVNQEQQGSGESDPPSTEMTLAAMIQFAARATGALLGEPDLAKASEPGGEKLAAWVSRQLRTVDPNWTLDTDPLVVHMAATGLAWRKRSFDDYDRVFRSHFLPCTDVIINANVRAAERAPRITHQFERYPYEIERSIGRKHWVDYEPDFDDNDPQAPKKFYEVDAWLDLDDDGTTEPWTIVISRDDHAEVVKIMPRWSKKTIVDDKDVLFFKPTRRFYPYMFLPDPKGGFFPMGFGKLLSRVEGTADQLLASICDTAKSEAENGGVMAGGGVGLPDSVEIKGNRVTTIPTDGRKLADMYASFPTKAVSPGSVAVLEKVMSLGDRLAGTLNLLENAPASMTATMAKGIIDTGSQIQSAVHRRLVASLTQEIRMFVQMADAYDMLPEGVQASDGEGIAVTADPALATEMQRSALAGIYMEMLGQAAEGVPWNMPTLQLRLCEVLRLPAPQELIGKPSAPEASPKEKMDGMLGLLKQKNEDKKAAADAAVKLTQALKNIADAGGSLLNNQSVLLQMAQLEDAVQKMMQDNVNGPDDMAGQSGNQSAGALPPPAPGADGSGVSGGQLGGPGDAGPGSGLA